MNKPATDFIWLLCSVAFLAGTWFLAHTYPTFAWAAAIVAAVLAREGGYKHGFEVGRLHEAERQDRIRRGLLSPYD